LLDGAAKQLNDPFFGLRVGMNMQPGNFSGYGLALCACSSLRETAGLTMRFESLSHDLGRTELTEVDDLAFLRWRSPWHDLVGFRHACDLVAATFRFVNEWLVRMKFPDVEIDFVHAAPQDASLAEYERLLGARLRFGADVNECRVPKSWLDVPLANADRATLPHLERAAEQRLAARQRKASESPLVVAARERMQALLPHGRASLPEVADALNLTARTLQRRLAQAGFSFRTLLDDVRSEAAQRHLLDEGMPLIEVAFLLGFSEQSTFNHAFRQWFGKTPKEWRDERL
jgi:AraC-like DNA-binding protein